MHRRDFILSALTTAAFPAVLGASPQEQRAAEAQRAFAAIERRTGGRLGVAIHDTHRDARLFYRADERFPMCSTFKWLLAAQVLSRVDRRVEKLERIIPYGRADLLANSPVTLKHVGERGLSVAALCAAAIEYSDNTAANLLLATVGGPSGLTTYLRGIGDSVTRLDRTELELNTAIPGDPRDTTTPRAMCADLQRVLLGNTLSAASRERLVTWLIGNTTGDAKLRAGLPNHWKVGDKTGMCRNGATNDVAIIWPAPNRPVLVAAYLRESQATMDERNRALADVGRFVADWMST
jgi:beta-lactamase class A